MLHLSRHSSLPNILYADPTTLLYAATPSSGLLFYTSTKEDQKTPYFHDIEYYDEDLEPIEGIRGGESNTVSPISNDTLANLSGEEYLHPIKYADDDISVRALPFRHVDYLSHFWQEEDIWKSWRYIVSVGSVYENSTRLENASWRTWAKSKNNLLTIPPESLNWLKDCDVTWLYGPLLTKSDRPLMITSLKDRNTYALKPNSFLCKKSILRKRSISERILQRPRSASSQPKHTAAEDRGPTSELASLRIVERKCVYFNEQVEQCIALEIEGADDGDERDSYVSHDYVDSDSDDGTFMIMRATPTRKLLSKVQVKRSGDNKTIAKLPSTALKHGEHTQLAPSPPPGRSKLSTTTSIRIPVDEDWEDNYTDTTKQPCCALLANRRDTTHNPLRDQNTTESSTLNSKPPSTAPLDSIPNVEEAADAAESEGLFEAVTNTAKDLARLTWDIGWRVARMHTPHF